MPNDKRSKPSYEEIVRTAKQIILEEVCAGKIDAAAHRIVQIVASWAQEGK